MFSLDTFVFVLYTTGTVHINIVTFKQNVTNAVYLPQLNLSLVSLLRHMSKLIYGQLENINNKNNNNNMTSNRSNK